MGEFFNIIRYEMLKMLLKIKMQPAMIKKENDKSMPSNLSDVASSHSNRNMNRLLNEIDGFYSHKYFHQSTGSL